MTKSPKGEWLVKEFFKCKKYFRPNPRNWVKGKHLIIYIFLFLFFVFVGKVTSI